MKTAQNPKSEAQTSKQIRNALGFLLLVSTVFFQLTTFAQNTAFTYQGRLDIGGAPANGSYDLRFAIYDDDSAGTQQGNAITNLAAAISNGLFTVTLDFGNQFPGPSRWLEIAVRTNGSGSFTTNSPRQKITATPYAITAGNLSGSVNVGQLNGTIPLAQLPAAVVTNNQSGVNFTGSFAGNAGGLTNVPVSALVRTTNSTVVAWGLNSVGQNNVPAGLNNVAAVAVGTGHSLALKADGTVVAWGDNSYGQINVPVGLTNAAALAAGYLHSLALKSNGTVVAWGDNSYGETTVPAGLTNVVAVAGGFYYSLALKANGTVVAWGYNGSGQTNIPAGLTGVTAVAAGSYHSLALKADGNVVAWGDNTFGQTNVPPGLSNVMAVAGGSYHSLALKADGTVVAWGNNGYGEINVPAGLANVVAVTAGQVHSLALKNDGTVVAWGDNTYGETTVPAGLTSVVALAPGTSYHDLVIREESYSPVPWLSGNNTFSGQNNFNNAVGTFSGTFTGNGSGLTSLNAANLTGPVPSASLTSVPASSLTGTIADARIPNLDASKITTGTISDARLSTNVPRLDANQVFTGANEFGTNVGIGTPTPAALLEIQGGADSGGAGDPHAMVFSYRFGGYRHWIRSRHNSGATAGNAIDFFVNTSGSPGGSTGPGAGSTLTLTLDGGNVGIGNVTPTNRLHVLGGATFQNPGGGGTQFVVWTPGSGSWSFTSDRNTKDRVHPVDTRAVLEKVTEIPINEWSYIGYEQRHIGPMAQDFHEQFPLSSDDKSLNEADLHGVALAAIQGLNQKLTNKLKEKETELLDLRRQNQSLEKRLGALEEIISRQNSKQQ